MMGTAKILVVDDEPEMTDFVRTLLELESFGVETAAGAMEALERIRSGFSPDLVLLDVAMPGLDGLQTLQLLRTDHPEIKVVMLSCLTDPKTVVKAIRLGAQDYLPKPFEKAELDAVVRRVLGQERSPQKQVFPEQVEEVGEGYCFLAASEAMHKIRGQVGMIAGVDVPVLILGESGTGKEVVARLIYKLSARADKPFLKVNCAALPSELLESELFGYEVGAFTGAIKPKPGKFELCDKGTIFLDEIGEMSPALQAKLLHVLQDQRFSRLGSRSVVKVDVRVLAATNVDIPQALASKKLREDLYYRLNTFTLTMPPLRERSEEIPLLLRHFMVRFAERFARDPLPLPLTLVDAAMKYSWPGNLREMENFVKRYLILRDEQQLVQDLQMNGRAALVSSATPGPSGTPGKGDLKSLVRSLKDQTEMKAIREALQRTNWNRKGASRLLNISYKALLYKIREYGLEEHHSITA